MLKAKQISIKFATWH